MRITIVYMGGSRGQSGCDHESLEVAAGSSVSHVAALIAERHPALAPLIPSVRFARNHDFADADQILTDGDELALLPPVAGGAAQHTELTDKRLEPCELIRAVASPGAGATVLFVGTVRDSSKGRAVEAIEYQAYSPMAERQLERVAREATDLDPSCQVAIAHRHGRLAVGETAVVIAVSAPQRNKAFETCRAVLERLKQDVPIWKKETGPDGESWVGWR